MKLVALATYKLRSGGMRSQVQAEKTPAILHVQENSDEDSGRPSKYASLVKIGPIEKTEKVYICPFCFLSYTTGVELVKHLSVHGSWESTKDVEVTGKKTSKPSPSLPACRIFLTRCDRVRYDQMDRTKSGEIKQIQFQSNNLDHCALGAERVATKTVLRGRGHKIIHTRRKPYRCSVCYKHFHFISKLNAHRQTHTGDRPHQCIKCPQRLSTLWNLERHVLTHSGKKSHKCSKCNKTFRCKENLKKHFLTHSGEKCYKCLECDKTFTRGDNLKVHMRLHTGEKPYDCAECGKKFTRRKYLKIHMRIHTGEKPYSCSQCMRQFAQNGKLKVHIMRSHTGERPHKCTECGISFVRKDQLRNHILRWHP